MTKALYRHYSEVSAGKPAYLHLPMTVDLTRFDPQMAYPLPADLVQPYMAFVGVMNNMKDGIDILIEAFAGISSSFPAIKLYLYGFPTHETPDHKARILELGLGNRIFYRDAVSSELIPSILMNASLLLLPRPESRQAQGGFPTKLGEYLATGVPVCATRVGEIPQYLTDGESVFFADPGSVDSFALAISRALSDPALAEEVGKNGRMVAEKQFNKDIQAKILYDFLEQTVSTRI
jgi:glycosyltransferase involved in cell wall biosynthesis